MDAGTLNDIVILSLRLTLYRIPQKKFSADDARQLMGMVAQHEQQDQAQQENKQPRTTNRDSPSQALASSVHSTPDPVQKEPQQQQQSQSQQSQSPAKSPRTPRMVTEELEEESGAAEDFRTVNLVPA